MTISRIGVAILSAAALTAACSSSAPSPGAHDSGAHDSGARDSGPRDSIPRDSSAHDSGAPPTPQADSGFDAQGDGPPPPVCGAVVASGGVPSLHRAVATTCPASLDWFESVDPTTISCTTTADCTGDGGKPYFVCLNGHCSNDQCLTDADCGDRGACACARSTAQRNFCVPANCHVDSDCGPGGYCSPGLASCGEIGVYCHTPNDTCLDPARDCASCGIANPGCVYAPGSGTFVCGDPTCLTAG